MVGQAGIRAHVRRAPLALLCMLALFGAAFAAGSAQAAKKGKPSPSVSLEASEGKVASGETLRLKGAVRNWARGQRVLLLAKPTGTKRWSRAGAAKLRKNKRFSFKVKPPLGRTAYKAVAQRRGRKAPQAHSKPLRLLGLPGATATLSVGAGDQVTVGGLLPTPVKRKVVLQKREGGGWQAAGTTFSGKQGQVSFRVHVTASASYRLYAPKFTVKSKRGKSKRSRKKRSKTRKRPGAVLSRAKGKGRSKATKTYPPFTSPPIAVQVLASSPVSSRTVALTLPADLCTSQQTDATVEASPAQAGGAIQVQVSEDGGSTWTALGEAGEDASGSTSLRFVGPEVSGAYSFRAVLADGSASTPQTAEVHVCYGYPPLPQIYALGNTCEIDAHGETWCWGENGFGQIGDGSFDARPNPAKVAGGYQFVDLAVGAAHTCGLTADGKAYCWGSNGGPPVSGVSVEREYGALGDGTETNRSVPTAVHGGHSFVQLSAGGGYTCGVTATHAAYCWGTNANGQLGDGSLDKRLVPTLVMGGGFEEISAYYPRTCGLSGGRVFCWGDPPHHSYPYTPKPEDGVPYELTGSYPPLHGITVGANFGCGLSSAGAAYCWGSSVYGELGDGPGGTFFADTPVAVAGGHTFSKIEAGYGHACGLAEGGLTLCWGRNNFGPLGQGDSDLDDHPTPEPVIGGHIFARLGVGGGHTCAIDSGGHAWCWGANQLGQLGIGTVGYEESHHEPVTVLFP